MGTRRKEKMGWCGMGWEWALGGVFSPPLAYIGGLIGL